jgi:hypothetical protein
MKKFSIFLKEASLSQASIKAKQMGLKADGHGGWYNAQGEFVAKTIGGELKFYTKGQKVGEKDAPNARKPVEAGAQKQAAVVQQPTSKKETQKTSRKLTVVFGKFNPPSKDHKKIFDFAKTKSVGSDFKIYPSRSQDPKANPMDPDTKIKYMKKMFPEYSDYIINDEETGTIFDVLQSAEADGYGQVLIVVGSDRVAEFRSLAIKHNGSLYNFDDIQVIPGSEKDIDSNRPSESMSAKMRQSASKDDFATFKTGVTKELTDNDKEQLYKLVRKNMSESYELWEISPKSDYRNLRENYIKERIFKLGSIVENVNTGLIGKIIRRGTNYLICVTEDNIMFKSWITDVVEKKQFTNVSGVSSDQRKVGATSLTKYAMKMAGVNSIRNFINKYKVIDRHHTNDEV